MGKHAVHAFGQRLECVYVRQVTDVLAIPHAKRIARVQFDNRAPVPDPGRRDCAVGKGHVRDVIVYCDVSEYRC